MKLLVDIGNSCLKWALWEKNLLSTQQRLPYQYHHFQQRLVQAWGQLQKPDQGIWVANVAGPQLAENLTQWTQKHWQMQPQFITTSACEGEVKNGYKNAEQLGVDRWLALIGARHLEKKMLCVVDCGTAVTLDVLSVHGYHLGGLIMPGVTTMYNALLEKTYALAPVPNSWHWLDNVPLLAQETQMGITLGSLYAIIGLLEHVINSLENKVNKLVLILTGGEAPAIMSLLPRPYRYIPDLVLQGMVVVINRSL
ncbi:MAG: type III pantothenate kinase [Thioploca sp.]|nr:type III pantothenate kinase [Thioploca sp.]